MKGVLSKRLPISGMIALTFLTYPLRGMYATSASEDSDRGQPASQWTVAGQNLSNNRNQPREHRINPSNAKNLQVKWVYTTGGDMSATPTVAGNAVYGVDWGGNLFALRKETGDLIWTHQISEYNDEPNTMSRVSPLVLDDEVVVGDNQIGQGLTHNGANMIAVDRGTGKRKWITQVDAHPAAIITGSPVAFRNIVYVGVSSNEESLADQATYNCCTFRGSIVALDAESGRILWKTYTVPENAGKPGGYSGGAVWQPGAIDPYRQSLYIGTGNNYTAPQAVLDCQTAVLTDPTAPHAPCTAADDYFDTAMALDLQTGKVKWAQKLSQYDVWSVACLIPKPGVTCPNPSGPDYDFGGAGPNLLVNVVGFGQKSGFYWGLDPGTGKVLWNTAVGPGGTLGGIEFGTASDGERIFVPIGNNGHKSYTLANTSTTATGGSWSALSPVDGKILWQVADPTPNATDPGAASVANGVVFTGSLSGTMYALKAATGSILWSFESGGSVVSGPAIVDGVVYWGSGYKRFPPGAGNNRLYAFQVPGDYEDEF